MLLYELNQEVLVTFVREILNRQELSKLGNCSALEGSLSEHAIELLVHGIKLFVGAFLSLFGRPLTCIARLRIALLFGTGLTSITKGRLSLLFSCFYSLLLGHIVLIIHEVSLSIIADTIISLLLTGLCLLAPLSTRGLCLATRWLLSLLGVSLRLRQLLFVQVAIE